MRKFMYILFSFLAFASLTPAAVIGLFDYAFNIDGSITNESALDSYGDISATGLGNYSLTVTGIGSHSILALFDLDIDEPTNTHMNEEGSANGAAPAGLSWEIDEPGLINGDIYENFEAGSLDNSVFTTVYDPNPPQTDDVSMALGWDFNLAYQEIATIQFNLSELKPVSGFYLQHSDPDSPADIYFSSSLSVVPEPGTMSLFGLGLIIVWAIYRKKRS